MLQLLHCNRRERAGRIRARRLGGERGGGGGGGLGGGPRVGGGGGSRRRTRGLGGEREKPGELGIKDFRPILS